MKIKRFLLGMLLAACALMPAGCGMAAGPQTQKEDASAPAAIVSGDAVRVSNVDEFLAAIKAVL